MNDWVWTGLIILAIAVVASGGFLLLMSWISAPAGDCNLSCLQRGYPDYRYAGGQCFCIAYECQRVVGVEVQP